MKITGLETFLVPPRWLFLKITTDEGVAGWGEPVVEGRAAATAAAVHELEGALIGQDPFRIEYLWQSMYRCAFYRGGPVLMSAISGVDQALWDIKGKALGVPVYDLMGGLCRDRLKMYSWIHGETPEELAAQAVEKRSMGYTALKLTPFEATMHFVDSFGKVEAAVKKIAAIRDAVGYTMDVALDFHGRVHKPMAKVLAKELDPFKLLFIEEPVLPENLDALKEIARHTSTPIATGERLYSRWDFKRILEAGVVDIVQPDLSHAGGLSECRRIAAQAETYDVAVAPHCPLGPIALASCIQLDCATPNAFIQEQSLGIHYNKGNELLDYIKNPEVFHYEDGYVAPPKGPGLGIEVNEAYVREAAKAGHNWKSPVWRNEDGTPAEW
jgi:galactonate dehydratase